MIPQTLPEFLSSLESVRWFARLGEQITDSPDTPRIHDWGEWPGPQDEAVIALHFRHGELYDDFMGGADPPEALKETWDTIHALVFRNATSAVPYDPDEDTWHGPTMAVWQAAWTAGLIGLCLETQRQIPSELEQQWRWFLRGHWPCGYDDDPNEDESAQLVVF